MLIAKLQAYGLDTSSLNLLQDYLLNRKQRSKVKSFFSSWDISSESSFAFADNIKDVIQFLEEVGKNLISWFSDSQLKLNPDNCF